jgi:hypothetical protein
MRDLRTALVQTILVSGLLSTTGIALAETPPSPRHLAIIAVHPDTTASAAKAAHDGTANDRADVNCHHLLVCAKLQAEALIERLDATAPGAFLRLSSGVGLGYRF